MDIVTVHIIRLIEELKAMGVVVRTYVPQAAYSAASMIAITGTERYLGATAEHMIHYGTQWGWQEKTPTQTDRESDHKKRWFGTLLAHYKKYANIPELDKKIEDDKFYVVAKDCLKWGLADKIMGAK